MSYCQRQPEDVVKFVTSQEKIFIVEPFTAGQVKLVKGENFKSVIPAINDLGSEVGLLNFDELVAQFRFVLQELPDSRTGQNSQYSMADAALSAFSVFFMQSPSFLEYQKRMERSKGRSNVQTLFGVHQIPSNNQIRNLLDEVLPSNVYPVFSHVIWELNRSGHLDKFRSLNNDLLVPLDGTQYFSSQKIHCENCSTTRHKNGTITYSHKVITPVIVGPGCDKAISLPPEFITPQDGHDKQDCENAAAKRWLKQYGPQYQELGITISGDDLYCHQPLCQATLEAGFNFVFVCKPESHKTLYEQVTEFEQMGTLETVVVKQWVAGKLYGMDTYRFVNQVPLREGADALRVNWCELTTTLADGTVLYKNGFATNHLITRENVKEVVVAGRTRWKVENENNNTLKTKGYHLEHNFGHGKQHLSSLLLTLNLLAFLFHTVLELVDDKYRLLRQTLSSRQTFFDDIRALTRYFCFESWHDLLTTMIEGLELEVPDTS
jgi:hypothetical protein